MMLAAAALSLALASALASPCDVATTADVERLLGASAVDVPADEIGEETAPSCHWRDAKRYARVSVAIWSTDELPVVGQTTAAGYFDRLKADTREARTITGMGERAFSAFVGVSSRGRSSGAIVVLKGERVFVFDFSRVREDEARRFAAAVIAR
jgi:hypothetical protein